MMMISQKCTVNIGVSVSGRKFQHPNVASSTLLQETWSTDISIEHPGLPT